MDPSPPTLRPASWTPAIRMGLSISVATGLYGISFGALAVAAGLTVWQAMALSLLMFTGGSQFAFIGVIAGGGAGSAALGAAALLGVRNAVYGMQLNAMIAPTGWRKAVAAQLTIDESAATAAGQTAPDEQRRGFWTAGAGVFVLWNAFTLAGALLGVRNAVYGMQLNAMIAPTGWRKPVAAQLTIDESAATAAGQTAPDEQQRGFWTAGVGVFVLWNLFTLLGAVLGDALGDPRRWGLDGAAVAAFLARLWPRLKQREPGPLAVVCGVATALAVPLLPPGLPILLAAVVGAAWGWRVRSPEAPSVREEAAP